jgi:hypothetical protein
LIGTIRREYLDQTLFWNQGDLEPLGITGEVAEHEAARILGVELTPARQAGYDAIERKGRSTHRLQIKGRGLLPNSKPGQRLGSIDVKKDWDAVLLVLLNENFDATEIHEAQRAAVLAALSAPGSKACNVSTSSVPLQCKGCPETCVKIRDTCFTSVTAVNRRSTTACQPNDLH